MVSEGTEWPQMKNRLLHLKLREAQGKFLHTCEHLQEEEQGLSTLVDSELLGISPTVKPWLSTESWL